MNKPLTERRYRTLHALAQDAKISDERLKDMILDAETYEEVFDEVFAIVSMKTFLRVTGNL